VPGRVKTLRLALQLVLVVGLTLGAGAVAGWVWERSWTPATGVALRHEFVLDVQGAPADFAATGSYVGFALAFGVLAGLLAGLLTRTHELLTLVALLVAALAGGLLMVEVGHSLGPPDPATLAKTLDDFTPLESDLRVRGVAPLLSMPAGALLGLMAVYLAEVGIRWVRPPASPSPATLDRH
jgi:hypothetical protein